MTTTSATASATASDTASGTACDSPAADDTRRGLAELIEQIRRCTAAESDPAATARLVAGVLIALRPTAYLLTATEREGSADGYVRHTLHTEPTFSISAVVWRPGQITEIHDHLVWCSFLVLQGVETENIFGFDGVGVGDDRRLVQVGRRRRPAGSVSGVAPPDDIHQVHNTGDETAITLHVYGADLSQGTSVRRIYRTEGMPCEGS
ncbi:MAG: cysteine dioxygenase family protein [Catenulispora sp.]|nr:cysteine dioxygenase family protein [Catenulispora sp.]